MAAINRGRQIEQLLGRHVLADQRVLLRWVTAYSTEDAVTASLHEVIESEAAPAEESTAFDPAEEHGEGRNIGTWQSANEALDALRSVGTSPDRWVDFGILQDEVNNAKAKPEVDELDLSNSVLAFLTTALDRADPAPWSSWLEDRDGPGGDSFILVGPSDQRSEDIYVSRETTTRSNNELDAIALARSYLVPLIDEIRELRLATGLTIQRDDE